MKKIASILLSFFVVICFASCTQSETPEDKGNMVTYIDENGDLIVFNDGVEQNAGHVKHIYDSYSYDKEEHWQKCKGCDLETEKAAHIFSEWSTAQDQTDDEPGIKKRYCEICGYSEEVQFGYSDTEHWNYKDGKVLESTRENHNFSNYKIVEEATLTTPAILESVCSGCGYKRTKTYIADAMGHKNDSYYELHHYSEWKVDDENNTRERKCYDCGYKEIEEYKGYNYRQKYEANYDFEVTNYYYGYWSQNYKNISEKACRFIPITQDEVYALSETLANEIDFDNAKGLYVYKRFEVGTENVYAPMKSSYNEQINFSHEFKILRKYGYDSVTWMPSEPGISEDHLIANMTPACLYFYDRGGNIVITSGAGFYDIILYIDGSYNYHLGVVQVGQESEFYAPKVNDFDMKKDTDGKWVTLIKNVSSVFFSTKPYDENRIQFPSEGTYFIVYDENSKRVTYNEFSQYLIKDKTVEFDGEPHSIDFVELKDGYYYAYDDFFINYECVREIGEYVLHFVIKNKENVVIANGITATLTIKQKASGQTVMIPNQPTWVYFQTEYAPVYVYAWSSGSELASWPGVKMNTYVGDLAYIQDQKLYYYDLSGYDHVIFSWQDGRSQTVDLDIHFECVYYLTGTKTQGANIRWTADYMTLDQFVKKYTN